MQVGQTKYKLKQKELKRKVLLLKLNLQRNWAKAISVEGYKVRKIDKRARKGLMLRKCCPKSLRTVRLKSRSKISKMRKMDRKRRPKIKKSVMWRNQQPVFKTIRSKASSWSAKFAHIHTTKSTKFHVFYSVDTRFAKLVLGSFEGKEDQTWCQSNVRIAETTRKWYP